MMYSSLTTHNAVPKMVQPLVLRRSLTLYKLSLIERGSIMHIFKQACAFLAVAALVLGISGASWADEQLGYYRWPTTYDDKVVFTSEGDLWEAPLSGGMARRLTSALGEERFAMYSPDGRWIAFSGNYDGNTDVYVIPAGGGEPRRLTFHPWLDYVAAWSPNGRVVFRSPRTSGRLWQCYSIPPEGGWPEMLPIDQAAHITFEPGGDRIAYTRYSMGFHRWKRYKGGLAEDIWVGSLKDHDYRKVTNNVGNDATPMWYKGRIYYTRDNDARANIHSMKPDGSDIRQHTFHTEWDARWPTLSQGRIAYSLGADIWVYDIDKDETHKIDIYLPSERTQTRDKFVSPDDYTGDYALSPKGKRLLIGARGELFTASTKRRGVIHQITRSNDAREKGPTYTADGDSILTWSDLPGEEALYLYSVKSPGEPRKVANGTGGWNFDAVISPDGKYAVYGDNNRRLQLVSLGSGKTTEIDTSGWEIRSYEWSPDSRYIAYATQLYSGYNVVRIYDTKEKTARTVTDPLFSSYFPTWDPKGKWLYFISERFMNPRNSSVDWSFITQAPDEIFGLALDKETKSPYAYTDDTIEADEEEDEEKEGEEENDEKEKKDDDKEKKEEKVEVKIDWDGLADRIVMFPVDPGNYFGLKAIEGKLYFMAYPTIGWRDGQFDEEKGPRSSLHIFDIKKKKEDCVVAKATGFTLSHDNKKIAVRKKKGFVVMDAGATEEPKPDEDDPEAGLHLEEWVYDLDPRLEWRQMFNEAWRQERDFFYDPGMHGIDWKAQKEHYGSLLDRIGSRDELTDLIAQMIAELNAGHTYVGGGDIQRAQQIGVGLLGIDVTRHSSGFYRIDRILPGDRWDEKRTSPLTGVGMNVKDGDYLVAIDRIPTNTVDNYLELLNNKAGKLVIVSVNNQPSLKDAREIVVETLKSEWELRYWDWVYGRMEYVRKRAGDKIAYVHLLNMSGDGLEQWFREYYPQARRPALIMDVRYNGGGNIARWILSELERQVWAWGTARNGSRYESPGLAFYGHMVALCNELCGSDGETFSEGFKRLKLGPLGGERTWGGWVGIRGFGGLLDKGYLTKPEFTGWGIEGEWLIEGPGVYPDVEIQNMPKDVLEGKDAQLDWAIDYLLDKLEKEPKIPPPRPPFPDKRPTGYK
jgi:tricorn protease